jgi:hypothetical protein
MDSKVRMKEKQPTELTEIAVARNVTPFILRSTLFQPQQ